MSTRPTRSATQIDAETEKIILERLAKVDKERKKDAREAIAEIRCNLKQLAKVTPFILSDGPR